MLKKKNTYNDIEKSICNNKKEKMSTIFVPDCFYTKYLIRGLITHNQFIDKCFNSIL
jgi:hypothetical protein